MGHANRIANAPRVKICGLTRVQDAETCADAGTDAVGFIFYPPSPRCLTPEAAGQIARTLPDTVCTVGVFVNESYETIMPIAETAGLRAVQLHGRETPSLVERLGAAGLIVIKALFFNGQPDFGAVGRYPAARAYLVECVGGPLPGGNALSWNWSAAQDLSQTHPIVLAGGLTPDNITAAINDAQPDAVDVSSGVELKPGIKDPAKIRALCRAVSRASLKRPPYEIFKPVQSLPVS